MIESEGTILSYRPDPEALGKTFHYRQVETLLAQADDLMEKCLKDLNEYTSLDYAWTEFVTDLETQEKQLELDKKREDYVEPEAGAEEGAEAAAEAEQPAEEGEEPDADASAAPEAEEGEAGAEAADETPEEPAFTTAENVEEELTPLEIRIKALRRKRVLSGKGGPFALNEQRDLALRRLGGNYREALNRASVAEDGLKRLFDREEPPLPLPAGNETLSVLMTNIAIWVRDAIKWLEAYQQSEQPFTRVVSLRSLLNRNQWTQLKHSRDSYSLKLRFPEELFRSHENCRIRSIGASLVGEAGMVPWAVTVRVPERAIYERSRGAVEVDQTDVPPCLLGRVENRKLPCPSQLCDTTVVNASPMGVSTAEGQWTVDIAKPVGSSIEAFDHLTDVVIEINAVGIPRLKN